MTDRERLVAYDRSGKIITVLETLQKGIVTGQFQTKKDLEGIRYCIENFDVIKTILKRNLTNP